ncbi:hypothetical protein IGB42_04123 [Andreprevotia sp. IGB-42]|uniref:glycosyl transferase n=1 Tax=Andreprevotia sp. IGB-42 TaxID=2497473 RepID=UPI00135C13C5|nr:glycosyl transferase [Andreprevotia sp. IGB-42]KAF0811424.1 hypothetical protein IGB42_04123 [Andreprevotia sp. IGB-42]
MVVFFTSITTNYLPKARVLAASVKHHHPDSHFMLLLSDTRPDWLDLDKEPFDSVVTSDQLEIPDFSRWAFMHSVVELCTAVKGPAFRWLFKQGKADKAFYLDPDMVVFAPLTPLIDKLDQASVLLTPHQTEPEVTPETVIDNEICSLKHGVFNLGFLGVRNSGEGRRFIDWWADRLLEHCYDDIPGGIFTDQRWVDLAPCLFEDIHVVRDPGYNVATWNLSHRKVTGELPDGLLVNGLPLRLYHFSGFDSGAQAIMLKKYGSDSPTLWAMREWYIAECEKSGQSELGRIPCVYGVFGNGIKVEQRQRVLYRTRQDLLKAFPDPFNCDDPERSYHHWYQVTEAHDELGEENSPELLRNELYRQREALRLIHNSRSWKLAKKLGALARSLRLA